MPPQYGDCVRNMEPERPKQYWFHVDPSAMSAQHYINIIANMMWHWSNDRLMLGQRCRQCYSKKPTLDQLPGLLGLGQLIGWLCMSSRVHALPVHTLIHVSLHTTSFLSACWTADVTNDDKTRGLLPYVFVWRRFFSVKLSTHNMGGLLTHAKK